MTLADFCHPNINRTLVVIGVIQRWCFRIAANIFFHAYLHSYSDSWALVFLQNWYKRCFISSCLLKIQAVFYTVSRPLIFLPKNYANYALGVY